MKRYKFATARMLYARHIASWKTKINNSFTTESELLPSASAFYLKGTMLKIHKIYCIYLVVDYISLQTL